VWVPDEQEVQADQYFPGGAPDFQISCAGPDGQSVLVTLFDIDVPLGAATVPVDTNVAGYFSDDAIIGNDQPIEITLDRFDGERIAGGFSFTGEGFLSDDLSTVTVTFDFSNDFG
jgi:hypothetical protein